MHRRAAIRRSLLSRSTFPRFTLARVRQMALIGTGWSLIGLGALMSPLPGPFGFPVALAGGVILLRNSADARRLFVRLKRRHPRLLSPVERIRVKLRRRRNAAKAKAAATA
ncbi:hypothetical protein GBZ26_11180 [Azospirillum formosense]|uniref:Transmembrane protein PGPGW n=2 Tax=Azospirillum formosense TaxID=861533 RepID=A0ABX2KVN7_9PROT|nr:hypothetical protein [Azospirillum formosense]MBY3755620.1 hypothetical protein [Azospirillum formosense]NUB19774.1 hypothetical protein [Azospirillum formosense]